MQLVTIRPTKIDSALADLEGVGLQQLVDHDDQRGDDGDLHDQPDRRRDVTADQADDAAEDRHSTTVSAADIVSAVSATW